LKEGLTLLVRLKATVSSPRIGGKSHKKEKSLERTGRRGKNGRFRAERRKRLKRRKRRGEKTKGSGKTEFPFE